MTTENPPQAPGMSDEAVRAKTGKGWDEWLAILDDEGATSMSHKDIAVLVIEKYGIPGWWAQTVTVGYERARGMREKHQTPQGYQASASKTIAAPLQALYGAWADDATRAHWLPDPISVAKATPNRSLRAVAHDGITRLSVGFHAKGNTKSQVSLQHEKLTDATAVEQSKAYWSEALERLKAILEQPHRA
ncbi:MAG: hypothetical protein WD533_06865 [Dehalococcoidia bacterium]